METLYPIAGFITVATITPGPNNFIVLSAAARRGFRAATLPIAGILSGGLALLVLCWAGVGTVLHAVPWFRPALVVTGALYLAWIGLVMILRAGKRGQENGSRSTGLPGTFLGVAAFQVANPKGWVLLLTATAAMQEGGSGPARLALLAATFTAISVGSSVLWAGAGALLVRRLQRPSTRAWFDRLMGGLLIASAALLLR